MHNLKRLKKLTPDLITGLADYLCQDGIIEIQTAKSAIHAAEQNSLALTHYLTQQKIATSQQIFNCCKKHFDLPIRDANIQFDLTLTALIPRELIEKYRVIPIAKNQHTLIIGVTDPGNQAALADISFHTGLNIQSMLIAEDDVVKFLSAKEPLNTLHAQLENTLEKIPSTDTPHQTLDNNDEPISHFVDRIIQEAIEKHASDIHIEPHAKHCRIRYRCDGLLHEIANIPTHLAARIIIRLKVMANLNIAEKRLPQDGRILFQQDKKIDIRLNTCPVIYGEKIVLRLIDAQASQLSITSLGLSKTQQHTFYSKLINPQGLILVTGPTGCGKTATLYSALQFLNSIEKNITTIEDPVEIELAGINQVNINNRIGLTFSHVLRTLLRQDPDVIMVGEIRDLETANIAMQAAQTGHLVLSTLHANNALDAITRLHAMGVSADNFIHSISLIIAQRLIRKLCEYCKTLQPHSSSHSLSVGINAGYYAVGCQRCHQGYAGRTGVFEMIPMTETLSTLILTAQPIKDFIRQENYSLLKDSCREKLIAGVTSYAEYVRVLGG